MFGVNHFTILACHFQSGRSWFPQYGVFTKFVAPTFWPGELAQMYGPPSDCKGKVGGPPCGLAALWIAFGNKRVKAEKQGNNESRV
jgi:hypothetical protein